MLEVFEKIINDPKKMLLYKKNVYIEASFMSLYKYAKEGLKFSDLPWFDLANQAKSNNLKKAA